jgi:hypothetical protein
MRTAAIVTLLCCFLGCTPRPAEKRVPSAPAAGEPKAFAPPAGQLATGLQNPTTTPKQVQRLAIAACKSGREEEIVELTRALSDPQFLSRLDDEDDDFPPDRMNKGERLEKVLRAFAKYEPAKAELAFLRLASEKRFTAYRSRLFVLIRACSEFRQPSKEILDFLEAQAQSEKGEYRIDDILVAIGSKGSLERLENRFFEQKLPINSILFTNYLLEVRDQPNVVDFYRRILAKEIADEKTRNLAVQSLFDYRPFKWYNPSAPYPKAPDRREASDDVLGKLLSIADFTKTLGLTSETRQCVAKGRAEIEEIVEFRKSGKPAEITKKIAMLDSTNYGLREQASRELKDFGDWALPQLRASLASPCSTETRTRIERIIEEIVASRNKKNGPK